MTITAKSRATRRVPEGHTKVTSGVSGEGDPDTAVDSVTGQQQENTEISEEDCATEKQHQTALAGDKLGDGEDLGVGDSSSESDMDSDEEEDEGYMEEDENKRQADKKEKVCTLSLPNL